MSDAGIIAVVSGYVSLAGLIAYLVVRVVRDANALQAMDDERDKAIVRAERAEFELGHTKDALADANRTIDALAKEPRENPNADLAPDNLDDRLLRAAKEARADRRGAVPGAEATAVHPPSAGPDAATAEVLPAGPGDRLLDPDEPLL